MYSHMFTKKIPKSYRVFQNELSEQLYLFIKISYWLHVRENRKNCRRYIDRLFKFKNSLQKKNQSISIGVQSMLATIAEYERRWSYAIKHRKKEVALIIRLYKSFTPDQSIDLRKHVLQHSKPRQIINYLNIIKKVYISAGQDNYVKTINDLQNDIRSIDKSIKLI